MWYFSNRLRTDVRGVEMVCTYLEKLYEEYLNEKIQIEKSIVNLQTKLKENIEFIRLLEESTDASYESFSPRDINSKNKIQAKELKEEQKNIIIQIDKVKIEQTRIIQKLDELSSVIKVAKSSAAKLEDIEGKNIDKLESNHNVSRLALLEIQENERQRISRELHDSTVQNLTGIVHKAELCSKLIDMDPIRCKLEMTMMSRTLRDIINDTRQMIYDLRPMSFDDMGLDITIERAIDKIKNDKSCNIGFVVEGDSYLINPVVGITLLRIIQEACNNAIKYAEANIILVKMIYQEEAVIISVEDDGKGFDVKNLDVTNRNDNSGFGLSMMRERVYLLSGEIHIDSELNNGTKIQVKVPIYKKEEN